MTAHRWLVALTLAVIAVPLEAHIWKSDRGVGVLIHVDPDDAPVAERTTGIHFQIKSPTVDVSTYNHRVVVTSNDRIVDSIETSPRRSSDALRIDVETTFPSAGAYTIALEAYLSDSKDPAYRVAFDLRVEELGSSTNSTGDFLRDHLVHIFVVAAALCALVFALLVRKPRKR